MSGDNIDSRHNQNYTALLAEVRRDNGSCANCRYRLRITCSVKHKKIKPYNYCHHWKPLVRSEGKL